MPTKKSSESLTPAVEEAEVSVQEPELSAQDSTPGFDQPSSVSSAGTDSFLRLNARELEDKRDDFIERRGVRQERDNVIGSFMSAIKRREIMYSRIAGAAEDGNDAYWVCYDNAVQIRIPFTESFESLPEELLDPAKPSLGLRRKQFLSKSIGAEVAYVITSYTFDPEADTYCMTASRIAANKRIRARYFGPSAVRRLQVGDTVKATIMSVGSFAAYVSFGGLDVRLENRDVSHRYLPSLESFLMAGNQLRLRIMGIEDTNSDDPKVKVSARPVELDDAKQNLNRVKAGDRFAATITSIRRVDSDKGVATRYSMWLEYVDLPGFATTRNIGMGDGIRSIRSGDKVWVQVTGVTDNGYVHSRIIGKIVNP